MKRMATKMTLAVAAFVLAAGTVSAQTMKAEIPFAFRVGRQVMQPGPYRVTLQYTSAGAHMMTVASLAGNNTALLVPWYHNDAPKAWASSGLPRLVFACGDGPCVISRVWNGSGDALNFRTPRGKNGEPHIAEVILRPAHAD